MSAPDSFEEFERQPKERWPLLAQQPRFRAPAVVTALLRRAIAHRRTDHGLARAAAEAAARLTRAMPEEPALRAWALAELANSRRTGEDFETASRLIGEAEAVLPGDAPAEVRGHVVLVKGAILRDLLAYDEAIAATQIAVAAFENLPFECVHALTNLGLCLSQQRRFLAAAEAYERALGLLLRDTRIGQQVLSGTISEGSYFRLVGMVQVNGLLVWVRQAEQESDPTLRCGFADRVLNAIKEIRRTGSQGFVERENAHFDWIEARALICCGLHRTAIRMLERVRGEFEAQGRFIKAADVGNDLLFAHAALGDLRSAAGEAQKMLTAFREHDLPKDYILVFEQMAYIERREAALNLLRGAKGARAAAPDRAIGILEF